MHKQSSLLWGKIDTTRQQVVQCSNNNMRQNVFKEHVSGDPLPDRTQYTMVTHMIELIWFKRFELNQILKFVPAREDNFNILKRSLVV